MGNIQISPSLQGRLQRVVSNGPDALSEVIETFKNLKDQDLPLLSIQSLEAILQETDTEENAYALSVLLINLLQMKRDQGITSSEVVEKLRSSVSGSKIIDSDFLQSFDEISSMLSKLLDMDCISVVEKAVDLTYDYKCLMKDTRILTDIRPVFDEEKNTIVAGIISHTMRISIHQDGTEKTFSIALDSVDVNDLLDQCKKALLKAKVSKEFMAGSSGTKTIIVGEN